MRTLRLGESATAPALVEETVPRPETGRGELLIQVYAAGLTPSELQWYPTFHGKTGEKRSGAVPGHEFSGVVAALGEDAAGFEIGDEVYGLNDWFSEGAMAEYCVTQPSSVALKPRRLTHVEAASVPIGALTAWQALFDHAKLEAGERVLIHGGAGSVGLFAIQLARLHGAQVISTASGGNLDFVSRLGAEQVIDYRAGPFEDSVRDVDVVLDTVGGETLARSWAVLKRGGRMVTIAAGSETADEREKQAFFIVEPNQKQLVEVANLLDTGQLQAVVDAVLSLNEAPPAYAGNAARRLGRGKLVVSLHRTGTTI